MGQKARSRRCTSVADLRPERWVSCPQQDQFRKASAWSLFRELWAKGNVLCVGLDPSLDLLPDKFRNLPSAEDALFSFNREIVDATNDLVCAYKPNSAFYEQYGDVGFRALQRTILYINDCYPAIPVILDAKRADIGSTTAAYAHAAFDVLGANAMTVNPYLGQEALAPNILTARIAEYWYWRRPQIRERANYRI